MRPLAATTTLSCLFVLGLLTPAVQAQETTISITTPINLTNSLSVPSNITFRFSRGGRVILGPNVVLTVHGGIEAGPYQIFENAAGSSVVIEPGHVSRVYPQWWGPNNEDSVQRALTAAAHGGCELFLPAGNYVFNSTVEHRFTDTGFAARGLTVRGAGPGRTVIDNQSVGLPAFFFGTGTVSSDTGWFLTIEGLELTSSNGLGSDGLVIEDVWMGRISSCLVSN